MLRIGHRGAPGGNRYQENTLASFQRALFSGADAIEFDVQRTKDDELVVFHDDTLAPLIKKKKGAIRDYTLKELKSFRIHGEPIATLEEVFEEFGDSFRMINAELKVKGVAEDVNECIARFKLRHTVIVSSFYWEEVRKVRAAHKALLVEGGRNPQKNCLEAIRYAKKYKMLAVHMEREMIDWCAIEKTHDARLLLNAWVVNDAGEMEKFKKWGVDGIFSDFPALL